VYNKYYYHNIMKKLAVTAKHYISCLQMFHNLTFNQTIQLFSSQIYIHVKYYNCDIWLLYWKYIIRSTSL